MVLGCSSCLETIGPYAGSVWILVLLVNFAVHVFYGEYWSARFIESLVAVRYFFYPCCSVDYCTRWREQPQEREEQGQNINGIPPSIEEYQPLNNDFPLERWKADDDGKESIRQEGDKQKESEVASPSINAESSLTAIRQDIALSSLSNHEEISGEDTLRTANLSNQRYLFLDNLKTFLTGLVVVHHVFCAFGTCQRYWFLIIGLDPSKVPMSFIWFSQSWVALNQAYFMSLFFFVSAYFIPSSYRRKGLSRFMASKRQRLAIPTIIVSFLVVPACIAIGFLVAGSNKHSIPYIPAPGHTWFLLWLLTLTWVYTSLQRHPRQEQQASESQVSIPTNSAEVRLQCPEAQTERMPFPSTWKRIRYGVGVCGVLQLIVVALVGGSFATMPQSLGGLPCDLLLFASGVVAQRNGWLEQPIRQQLDIYPRTLFTMVVLEMALLVVLTHILSSGGFFKGAVVLLFVIAGVFCVDMITLLLFLFQEYLNWETAFSKFLSRAAYTVYLIHPLVICGLTALYVWCYNKVSSKADQIVFPKQGDSPLAPPGSGGEDWFWIGWTLVTIASQILVWPISFGLTQLPVLRDIL